MQEVTKTLPEIMRLLQDAANSQEGFGADFNTKENSDWYAINWPVASLGRYVLDLMQNRFDNLELSKAEDPFFWGQSANFLFYRKMPDYAESIQMEATNPVIGAVADIGQIQIKKLNTDIVYINTELITVDAVPFYFKARCSELGSIGNAGIGEVTVLQSTPANWGDTFTNISPFEGGQDLETLETGRKRYFNQEATQTVWNEDGVYAAISRLSGVKSVKVQQNRDDITVDGIPRRAVHCVVDGGIKSEIIKTIFETTFGAYTFGGVRENITTLSGDTVDIGFDRPTDVTTEFRITSIPVSVPQSFKDAVVAYGDTIGVAGVASSDGAACYIRDNVPGASDYDSIYVSFKKTGDPDFVPAIKYGSNEKPNMIEEVI